MADQDSERIKEQIKYEAEIFKGYLIAQIQKGNP